MTADRAQADHERLGEWDAAYVLGALPPSERREFETHLEGCERCRSSVADLSGLPGLLGRLDAPRAFALLETEGVDAASGLVASGPIAPAPADLVARITRREDRRRRTRIRLLVGAAAAIVAAGAVAVPVAITSASHPAVTTALSRVVDSPLSADVKLTSVGWGTRVDMSCSYGHAPTGTPDGTRWDYALWVVARDGDASELSSWSARSESTVALTAGTSVPVDQIAQVQVRADDGTVLLASRLTH